MEPNVDRGMWAIVALLVAVVIGGAIMLIFPNFVGQIGNEMTELMTNPSKIINKGNTGESVVLPTDPGYILATDDDFSGTSDGEFRYIGTEKVVRIPHVIKGVPVTSYYNMFNTDNGKLVEKVISDNDNVNDMVSMFYGSSATTLDLSSFDTSNAINMRSMFFNSSTTTLDLSSFDTSNVTDMRNIFRGSSATSLDLSSFDTSKVNDMRSMFQDSSATTLDLSSFDTSKVNDMEGMFQGSSATTLDLSSFDTSSVPDMDYMFSDSAATTGYARTQTDANRFNASFGKPAQLTFVVK